MWKQDMYVARWFSMNEFCVVALSKHTYVTGMTQGSQNCAQIRFTICNRSFKIRITVKTVFYRWKIQIWILTSEFFYPDPNFRLPFGWMGSHPVILNSKGAAIVIADWKKQPLPCLCCEVAAQRQGFECVWLLCLNGLEYGGKSQYKNTCSLLLCCNCWAYTTAAAIAVLLL